MSYWRAVILTLGPILVTSLCYVVAAPIRTNSVLPQSAVQDANLHTESEWNSRCQHAADVLRTSLPASWSILLKPPLILASDLKREDLETITRQTIDPTCFALQVDYFDHDPQEPITLLVASEEESYRIALQLLKQPHREEYSGLYARDQRTVVLNLATGTGTVAHELTHALAHADFPNMPEWLDEGLASLQEASEFTEDHRHLMGRDNWRLRYLQEAEQRQCWKALSRLFDEPFAKSHVASLDYALARYFCLFLQERGVLPTYYRKCREWSNRDQTGKLALLRIFPGQSLDDIEHDFRVWLHDRSERQR